VSEACLLEEKDPDKAVRVTMSPYVSSSSGLKAFIIATAGIDRFMRGVVTWKFLLKKSLHYSDARMMSIS
jgi:hypothetical protein